MQNGHFGSKIKNAKKHAKNVSTRHCSCSMQKNGSKKQLIESFRFEDEDEDEDEDEALCFRHNEIFKLFRFQLGRDNVVAINFVVPAKLKTKKFEDFVVVKTESFVLVLDFVLVLEYKALLYSRNETILKIGKNGHQAKAIAFAKWSFWVKN